MTTSANDTYTSPLASRNASPEMLRIWSPRHKFDTWRRIWLAVAEAQHEVTTGWDTPLVSQEQLDELRTVVQRGITDEEIARASELERDLRHDVMAHVHCLGEQCPKAKGIVHLGCTSQDVVCNGDLLVLREALQLAVEKADRLLVAFGGFAQFHSKTAALGFTHYQPAQPTTLGRRCAQWASETALCRDRIERHILYSNELPLRGFRGATGTQASFQALLGSDAVVERFEATVIALLLHPGLLQRFLPKTLQQMLESRIRHSSEYIEEYGPGGPHHDPHVDNEELDQCIADVEAMRADGIEGEERRVAQEILRENTFKLTTQTYPRVVDTFILADLASVASVLHKIATDIRLLSNRKEIDEPFGAKQIGSSAMPYKRNPMKCERICGLTRFVMNLVGNAYDTAATQWLERTLDDSSNRRLSLPEAFLALDGALDLMHQVASGLVVHEAMVRKNLMAELPFLATENILMEAVKLGGDRQELHEKIRVHAQAAGMRVKQEGLENDLIERLRGDDAFAPVHHLLTEDQLLDPMKYVGRSVEQTERFLKEVVEPLRERYGSELASLGASDRGV